MDPNGGYHLVREEYLKIDMHVHTHYSEKCGWTRPKKLIESAKNAGLDGIAITDHDTINGALEVSDFVNDENINLKIIIGEEITTDLGEVLAYFIPDVIKPGLFIDVINSINQYSGISAIPHPYDRIRRGFSEVKEAIRFVDAIEVYNSRCLFNKKALELCNLYNKAMLGGSDAHFPWEIGNAWTVFSTSPKIAIIDKQTDVSGNISNPMNLALTKGVKIWRKIRSI